MLWPNVRLILYWIWLGWSSNTCNFAQILTYFLSSLWNYCLLIPHRWGWVIFGGFDYLCIPKNLENGFGRFGLKMGLLAIKHIFGIYFKMFIYNSLFVFNVLFLIFFEKKYLKSYFQRSIWSQIWVSELYFIISFNRFLFWL